MYRCFLSTTDALNFSVCATCVWVTTSAAVSFEVEMGQDVYLSEDGGKFADEKDFLLTLNCITYI